MHVLSMDESKAEVTLSNGVLLRYIEPAIDLYVELPGIGFFEVAKPGTSLGGNFVLKGQEVRFVAHLRDARTSPELNFVAEKEFTIDHA